LRDAMEVRIEAALRSAPKLPNIHGPGVAAPGIRQFGTPAQIDRLLVPLLRGDEWWALGMSEPEAGSDFAGLRTRAQRDGPNGQVFRVNGHKIWTTQAHLSRWCTLYARTDPDAPKHRGISCLILDLHSPGVRIEPIRMASVSDETFCEVFLDDVEVPADNLLGPLHGGWNVALASLHHERQMIWIMNWVEIKRGLDSIRGAGAAAHSPDLCTELGSLLADAEALRATGYRALGNELAGRPSPEADILKLLGSVTLQRVWEFSAVAAGPGSVGNPDLLFERQDALAATIYGGTSEVQRNIIAERLLGLPKG
jgi:alkylation response protein AidB-like acyl-CoA dehydrogenase